MEGPNWQAIRRAADSDKSMAMLLAETGDGALEAWLETLSPQEQEAVKWDWDFWARPKQLEPDGDWRTWLVLAGRGFGKTRMGSEWVKRKIRERIYRRINVVGATTQDTRDIIVEGPSGIMSVCPPEMGAIYQPTKRRIAFANGAVVMCYSADEPERLRGHQCDGAWADELAAWRYEEAWTQLMLGLRLGPNPRVVVTTTPKPTRLIKSLARNSSTRLTQGSTYENFRNLADTFTDEIIRVYEGTRIGRQELLADILDDSPGALWKREHIDEHRVAPKDHPELRRIVVAVDPAVSFDSEEGDETGIVVAGVGVDDRGYVLEDLSGRMKPEEWGQAVVRAYYRWQADRVVAEINQGGDMVGHTIRMWDPQISYQEVRASRGKQIRAEPVAALYEQGKVSHAGMFDRLEDQLCTWEPGPNSKSPDRLDALVWAFTALMVTPRRVIRFPAWKGDSDLVGRNYWKAVDAR